MTFAQVQGADRAIADGLSHASWISVSLLLVLISATWWLGRLLGKIEMALFQLKMSLDRLKHTPARLSHIENHMMALEEDLNNLWAAVRSGEGVKILPQTRRSVYRPLQLEDPTPPSS